MLETIRGVGRGRLVALLLFLGLFAIFVVVQRAAVAAYDGKIMYAVGRAIVHHRLSITPAEDAFGRHTPYSSYGIGLSLLIAPLYLLQRAVGVPDPTVVTLANPLLLAGTGTVLFACGRQLGWRRPFAVLVSTVFAVLTMALQASTELFSEPGVAFSISLVILGCLRWRANLRFGPAILSFGVALSILFRTDSAVLVAPALALLPLVIPRSALWRRRSLVMLALPIAAAVAWSCWYSELRSGTLLPQQYGGRFSAPFLVGLRGLLLSHGKSLFVFNPVLLLAIPSAAVLWRRGQRAITVLLVVLAALRPLFYARWNLWPGDVAWGPRFLMPCTVPLVLLAGEFLRAFPRFRLSLRLASAGAVFALGAAATIVSLASVWVPYEASFNNMKRTPGLTGRAAAAQRAHNADRYLFTLHGSAIGYNLSHLHTRHWALSHFRGGASPVGVAALGLAIVGPVTAAFAGRRRDAQDETVTTRANLVSGIPSPTRPDRAHLLAAPPPGSTVRSRGAPARGALLDTHRGGSDDPPTPIRRSSEPTD